MQFEFGPYDDGKCALASADKARKIDVVGTSPRVKLIENQVETISRVTADGFGKAAEWRSALRTTTSITFVAS